MQALQIWISIKFMKEVNRVFSSFVWAHNTSRLPNRVLCRLKTGGGLALPHASLYYQKCHLARVMDWCKHAHLKQLVHLEQAGVDGPPISALTEYPPPLNDIPRSVQHGLHAVEFFSYQRSHQTLPPPLGPILGNPAFPELRGPIL